MAPGFNQAQDKQCGESARTHMRGAQAAVLLDDVPPPLRPAQPAAPNPAARRAVALHRGRGRGRRRRCICRPADGCDGPSWQHPQRRRRQQPRPQQRAVTHELQPLPHKLRPGHLRKAKGGETAERRLGGLKRTHAITGKLMAQKVHGRLGGAGAKGEVEGGALRRSRRHSAIAQGPHDAPAPMDAVQGPPQSHACTAGAHHMETHALWTPQARSHTLPSPPLCGKSARAHTRTYTHTSAGTHCRSGDRSGSASHVPLACTGHPHFSEECIMLAAREPMWVRAHQRTRGRCADGRHCVRPPPPESVNRMQPSREATMPCAPSPSRARAPHPACPAAACAACGHGGSRCPPACAARTDAPRRAEGCPPGMQWHAPAPARAHTHTHTWVSKGV